MYEKAIAELKNQIRIIDQKLPSIDESIKTYTQMTKNYQKEYDELIAKRDEYRSTVEFLTYEDFSRSCKEGLILEECGL